MQYLLLLIGDSKEINKICTTTQNKLFQKYIQKSGEKENQFYIYTFENDFLTCEDMTVLETIEYYVYINPTPEQISKYEHYRKTLNPDAKTVMFDPKKLSLNLFFEKIFQGIDFDTEKKLSTLLTAYSDDNTSSFKPLPKEIFLTEICFRYYSISNQNLLFTSPTPAATSTTTSTGRTTSSAPRRGG